jgi:LPS-assembly lipoprotein
MWWSEPKAGPSPATRDDITWLALRCVAALAIVAMLGGCGFHLRGQATYTFSSIFINASKTPIFQSELTRALEGGGNAKVLQSAEGAQVILDVPGIVDDKQVLSLTTSGSVQEYELVMRVTFRLHDASGIDWLPPGEIVLRRAYTFNDSEVLARGIEEQRLLREMQNDAVAQLVRRLQAARKPA